MKHPSRARERTRRRRRIARTALTALALAAVIVLVVVASGLGDDGDRRARAGASSSLPARPAATPAAIPAAPAAEATPVAVHLASGAGSPVPARFLGLSFEASSLPQIGSYAAGGDFTGLLRSLGPGVLRFGGVSADTRIAWSDASTPPPSWTPSVLKAADLRRLGELAARSGWQVLLTVGLAHYAPAVAAREVRAAKTALGPWLAGVEVGNEPDAYARHGFRSAGWSPGRYNIEVRRYLQAIAKLTSGITLAAPGVSGSHSFVKWGRVVARAQRPALLTGHHYPLGCHQTPPPSIAALLSAQTRRMAAASLARYLSISRRSRIPFRMDEAGSVSCGGRPGISNTFAAALWATDYIAKAMSAGVQGINLQGNPANCLGYSPVCATSAAALARGELTARPVWYALLLTKALIGDRPLSTLVAAPAHPNLTVHAMLAADGSLHFVIVDADPPGSRPAAVSLHVGPRYGAASVLSLSAPSLEATSGVTLGGRAVAGDGSWQASSAGPSIPATGGVVAVTVSAASAALVTVKPATAG